MSDDGEAPDTTTGTGTGAVSGTPTVNPKAGTVDPGDDPHDDHRAHIAGIEAGDQMALDGTTYDVLSRGERINPPEGLFAFTLFPTDDTDAASGVSRLWVDRVPFLLDGVNVCVCNIAPETVTTT